MELSDHRQPTLSACRTSFVPPSVAFCPRNKSGRYVSLSRMNVDAVRARCAIAGVCRERFGGVALDWTGACFKPSSSFRTIDAVCIILREVKVSTLVYWKRCSCSHSRSMSSTGAKAVSFRGISWSTWMNSLRCESSQFVSRMRILAVFRL